MCSASNVSNASNTPNTPNTTNTSNITNTINTSNISTLFKQNNITEDKYPFLPFSEDKSNNNNLLFDEMNTLKNKNKEIENDNIKIKTENKKLKKMISNLMERCDELEKNMRDIENSKFDLKKNIITMFQKNNDFEKTILNFERDNKKISKYLTELKLSNIKKITNCSNNLSEKIDIDKEDKYNNILKSFNEKYIEINETLKKNDLNMTNIQQSFDFFKKDISDKITYDFFIKLKHTYLIKEIKLFLDEENQYYQTYFHLKYLNGTEYRSILEKTFGLYNDKAVSLPIQKTIIYSIFYNTLIKYISDIKIGINNSLLFYSQFNDTKYIEYYLKEKIDNKIFYFDKKEYVELSILEEIDLFKEIYIILKERKTYRNINENTIKNYYV
jgi:hypothetical protein